MAQHIDKRIPDISSRITALQKVPNFCPSLQGVFLQPREKVGQREIMCINLRIFSNSAKCYAGRPLLLAYNFLAIMASTSSTYRFGAMPSLKSLTTKNITTITASIFENCRQSEARNFETAEYIDKRISDFSSRTNALQQSIKLGAISPRGFSATYGEVGPTL